LGEGTFVASARFEEEAKTSESGEGLLFSDDFESVVELGDVELSKLVSPWLHFP
jgi:hypothetical protein